MLEKSVEDYLCEKVIAAGGEVRKTKWIGRRHAPDRRVMHPKLRAWVELKRPGGKLRPGQAREIERMRQMGEKVFVIDNFEEVDWLVSLMQ